MRPWKLYAEVGKIALRVTFFSDVFASAIFLVCCICEQFWSEKIQSVHLRVLLANTLMNFLVTTLHVLADTPDLLTLVFVSLSTAKKKDLELSCGRCYVHVSLDNGHVARLGQCGGRPHTRQNTRPKLLMKKPVPTKANTSARPFAHCPKLPMNAVTWNTCPGRCRPAPARPPSVVSRAVA